MRALRIIVPGVAAAVAWAAAITVVFGPAQAILADPELQSAKFIAAFAEPPLPRMAGQPAVLLIGLLIVGLLYAAVYAWLEPKLSGGWVGKGTRFGLVAWALMVPWFELYLPYNVMLEPLPLVLLEVACWLVVMLAVGLAIAGAHGLFHRTRTRPAVGEEAARTT